MPKTKRKPSYLLHKATGQARVRINGKDVYLGPYGSQESRDRYDDLVADWLAENDISSHTLTIADLSLLYLEFAEGYYRKDGKPTPEVNNVRIALRPLVKLYRNCRAREFSPRKLKDVRQSMIDAGCVRTSINRQVGRIKRMFRWAVENEYVPADVYAAVSTIAGLRTGRSDAEESVPVRPVSQAAVDAVQPHVTRQVRALIQFQRLTGCRPGEAVRIRGRDLNLAGKIWEYVPSSHKTQHHGKSRTIFIGPKAQEILKPFLRANLMAYLFSPADAWEEHLAERRASRKTPLTPSQRARTRKPSPKKKKGERYTTSGYGYAIRQACIKAKIDNWHPNQLRHSAATELRREYGIESARVILGHASAAVTEVYAEADREKARSIIAKIG